MNVVDMSLYINVTTGYSYLCIAYLLCIVFSLSMYMCNVEEATKIAASASKLIDLHCASLQSARQSTLRDYLLNFKLYCCFVA